MRQLLVCHAHTDPDRLRLTQPQEKNQRSLLQLHLYQYQRTASSTEDDATLWRLHFSLCTSGGVGGSVQRMTSPLRGQACHSGYSIKDSRRTFA